ncbi:hypothetical protein C9374_004424 [Naegleria lovaniensis]|uniref:Exocyst complex component n=1 Tax=Naegleria lovaniensis TaxID=51637 RepID=A0AA88KJB2_NAELO|nr:uncharacterized protein C9374_004424 [Naegleria lovaniensis]KAG2383087.1 hypothetical protein C9374_004424 [Naegleria lovaniensis]
MKKLLGVGGNRSSVSLSSSPNTLSPSPPMLSSSSQPSPANDASPNLDPSSAAAQIQSHINSGDDFILASLVESGFITGSIKTVYERGKEDSFYDSLDVFLEKQKSEIEHICSENYEEFLKSVSQLKSVRSDGKTLKKKIISLNEDVQKAGREALECGKQLVMYHNIADNIQSAVQMVDLCKHVSTLASKVYTQIQEQKYFSALKTLDNLEKSVRTVHLFSFAQYLEKQIPIFRKKIKQNVERDFNQWLVNVKNKSQEIGRSMIEKQFKLMANNVNVKYNEFVASNEFNFTFPNVDIINDSVTVFDVLTQHKVELTPVYTCKHIYESMDSYEQFKGYYKRNRAIQLNHEITHPPQLELDKKSSKDTSIYPASIQEWLERIIGFFTVESVTLKTTSSLLSNIELNAMWEQSLQQIITTIDEHLAIRMNNPKEYLNMKKMVLIFSMTASEQLALHTSLLIDLLAHYRIAFSRSIEYTAIENIEKSDCKKQFTCVKQTPESVEQKNLKKFNLMNSSNLNGNTLTFPFSEIVLVTCVEIENFILDYEVYCDRIVSYTTSIKQMKNGVCKLFECALKCLDQELHSSSSSGVERYVQAVLNYQYMIDAALPYFEDLYSKRCGKQSTTTSALPSSGNASQPKTASSSSTTTTGTTTSSITYFKDLLIRMQQCKDRGEDLILKEVLGKCNKQLSQASTFVFAPEYQAEGVITATFGMVTDNLKTLGNNLLLNNNQSQIDPKQEMYNEPHPFIMDLIKSLSVFYKSIQHLKQEKTEQIMFSACDTIARYLKDIISTSKIANEITMKGMFTIYKDVQQLVKFCSIDLNLKNCALCFAELHTVLQFLIDMEHFNEEAFVVFDEETKTLVEHGEVEKKLITKFEKEEANRDKTSLLVAILAHLKITRTEFLKRTHLKKPKISDLKNLFKK